MFLFVGMKYNGYDTTNYIEYTQWLPGLIFFDRFCKNFGFFSGFNLNRNDKTKFV